MKLFVVAGDRPDWEDMLESKWDEPTIVIAPNRERALELADHFLSNQNAREIPMDKEMVLCKFTQPERDKQ